MKLLAVTYGTDGDARPIAMLCHALIDAGHDVTLLADGATLGIARALGVPHAALAGDIRGTLRPNQGIAAVVAAGEGRLDTTAKTLAKIANDHADSWMRQIAVAAESCDALIVAGLAAFVGLSVAEYRRIPAIGAGMFPITPTSAFPSPFLPPRIVPRWLNRTSHLFVELVAVACIPQGDQRSASERVSLAAAAQELD